MVPFLRPARLAEAGGVILVAAAFAGAAAPSDWILKDEDLRVAVPDVLDCDGDPEWRAFRQAARTAVERGFERSGELEAQAAALEARWRGWVCTPEIGTVCKSNADLGFDFVRELHRHCKDSNNFERYLIRHYFTNAGKDFSPLEAPSGFCLYGYATALAVLAWHSLPERMGEALSYLYTARHLMGHYHSFDFLESSSWPVTSFLLLVNLQHAEQDLLPFNSPPDYGHPGQYGTNFYFDRLRWAGTSEAAKSAPSVPRPPLDCDADALSRPRPQITVWQFCIHSSTAGEAVTMITRFLSHDFDVEFRGNSIAFQLCGNYYPSLCAPESTATFLDWLCDRFINDDMAYDLVVQRFRERLLDELLAADVWMCSIPAVWCQLLADAGRHDDGHVARPIFAYLGLPILQYVAEARREEFLIAFRDIAMDARNIVVANNAYLAEETLWQTGVRVPTLRIHGLHTNATYLPSRGTEVLVARPGTSGGWQECLLNRFLEANPWYPLRFVQFTDLLDPHTTREVYNTSLSYSELASYRALVSFPYDTSLMLFWEFYSMNMPIFVPFQLWRWGIFGQHTRPDLEHPRLAEKVGDYERPATSMFFSGFEPIELGRAIYWSKFTDWAMFPYIQYFSSLGELLISLVRIDSQSVSAAMKRFNEAALVRTVATWRCVVERWVALAAS